MSQLRFDHIAIALHRLATAAPFVAGELGGIPERGRPSKGFRWGTWRFEGGGRLEILEPMGADGFLHRFLQQRGPGIHHVTFKVPSLLEVCRRAEKRGYGIVGHDDSDPSWQEAFLHPKQALGVVVQFAESRPVAGAGERRRFEPPPGAPDAPPPATLLGLRMRAQSRERALRQWQEITQGECIEDSAGALTFRWPGSPMRIVVEIDAVSDEGPIAIELASSRPLALPDGAHPVLGAAFVQVAR